MYHGSTVPALAHIPKAGGGAVTAFRGIAFELSADRAGRHTTLFQDSQSHRQCCCIHMRILFGVLLGVVIRYAIIISLTAFSTNSAVQRIRALPLTASY